MPAVLSPAAQRINASIAGQTHNPMAPPNPGAEVHAASATEVMDWVPTEFGGLTHLFGGESVPLEQYAPVQTALTKAQAIPGRLGGLVPDRRRTGAGGAPAPRPAGPTLADQARATFLTVRGKALKVIGYGGG